MSSTPFPTACHPSLLDWQTVDPRSVPDWDGQVLGSSNQQVFHTTAWAKVLADTYGHRPMYVTGQEQGRIAAWLPLMEVRSPLTGLRGVSLPFTDECAADLGASPANPDAALHNDFLAHAIALGRRQGWQTIQFRGGFGCRRRGMSLDTPHASTVAMLDASLPGVGKSQPQEGAPIVQGTTFTDSPSCPANGCLPSLTYYGHRLDLNRDANKVFSGFDSANRRCIRKAMDSGLRIEKSQGVDALETYYRLHCRTRKKHGLPSQSLQFFRNIHQHFLTRQMGFVMTAWAGAIPVASAIFLHYGTRALFKFGASDDAYQALRGNNLVMWSAIEWLAQNGFETMHFGRTSIANEGLRRFKLGWGTSEYPIHYFKRDLKTGRWLTESDRAIGWHSHIFNHLPVWLLRFAGSLLYRHMD